MVDSSRKGLIKFIEEKQGKVPEELVRYIKQLAFYDILYLYALYQKFWQEDKELKIGHNFIPAALLSEKERVKELNVVDYQRIKNDSSLDKIAKEVTLVCNPMDGGLGSSLQRLNYLRKIWKETERKGKPHLGAKGEDLYFEIKIKNFNQKISVTEIKYLQAIQAASFYNKIIIQELVNEESIDSINEFLDETTNFWDRVDDDKENKKLTYRELIAKNRKIKLADKMIIQASLPTIDKKNNQLTTKRVAPGGHGQLGSMALGEAAQAELSSAEKLIRVIYNGDGPNNFPNQRIVGFMAKNKIPIIMITSTKTPIDQKGGQIGLELTENQGKKPQILELAQAEEQGQRDVFRKIGIKGFEKSVYGEAEKQYFNTNIALINYSIISPFLKDLYKLVGPQKFSKVISPDLIKNEKIQNKKTYIQLEGALASTLLNLTGFIKTTKDKKVKKLIKKHNINNFLVIVNIDKKERTKFFTPIKYAWDFWFYAYSDHFKLNTDNFKLKNLKPGSLPSFDLDPFYQDLENCLDAFGRASTIDLDFLTIEGKAFIKDAKLSGVVVIKNQLDKVIDLNKDLFRNQLEQKNNRLFLKDIQITIKSEKKIEAEKLTV
ncbi:MAG: UTP--glucose-1-phosphate uridylyltransferase [Candidatus Omnitrophica bacterium]|nr:UTP--glucose-1-phosphate uridylyltransferase [Candidatus Omnitrophota bacterium]MCF7891569.1 UTP--glucose-1-phosphate uridylyltransferase [Candidatus Omnitrophota bacterium]MCF7898073.1 UTP--glucose-1-phosphate uridylyltransferase [Candidatus Omnitrophota bacterium]MCF7909949.1 UTP--glucose-1-phosphate uridylyltransferase [Candidatus Omnitrophota bacterium]